MSEEKKGPFPGATHVESATMEFVKAVRWVKDGDHPKVERYPVEKGRRPGHELAPKGLLRAGPREKYALRFGDWVLEDSAGRLYVVSGQARWVEELVEHAPGLYRQVRTEVPSEFDQRFMSIEPQSSAAGLAVALLVGLFCALFGPPEGAPFIVFGVTHLMYYSALLGQWNGTANAVFDLDEAADDVKVSIHTNTYAPNQDTHDFFDDVTNEVSGTNYSAGGSALANQLLSRASGVVTFDADDVVWTQSGAGFSTGRKFVIRRNSGASATSRLFSVITADADVGNVSGDLTLAFSASGIATWSTT